MKRIIIISALLLSIGSLKAQEFFVGPKVGIQYYNVRFAEADLREENQGDYRMGFKAGGTIIFPLAEDFYFGSEVYYSRKGRTYIYAENIQNEADYNFIEFSGFIRKSFPIRYNPDLKPGNFFFNIGPNVSYWLSGNGTLNTAVPLDYKIVFSEPVDADFTKNYVYDNNRWLLGLDFGAGMNFPIRNNQFIFIEARYTYGHSYLGNQFSSSISILEFFDDLRAQYRVFNVSLAYLFDINIKNLRKGKSTIKRSRR